MSDLKQPQAMRQDLLERYLKLLGISKQKPNLESLTALVRAHVERVPFENISKLYYKKHLGLKGLPSLDLFLDGIERFHFGGTCYSNNIYLHLLLANLDYEVKLCGADMSNPDVHLVSMVSLGEREYLVDAGYAAPFSAPLPRDLPTDFVIVLGRDRFVLKPQDARGCSRLELYRDGVLKHGYLAKPFPKNIEDFEHVIADSYRDSATFMNALLLARFFSDRSVVIHNLTVVESSLNRSSIRTLSNRNKLVQAVYEHFAIPKAITLDVVSDLGPLGDAWS